MTVNTFIFELKIMATYLIKEKLFYNVFKSQNFTKIHYFYYPEKDITNMKNEILHTCINNKHFMIARIIENM